MPITNEDLSAIVKAIETPIKALIDKRIEEAFNAHVQSTLTPIVQELAQRDELIENNIVGRVLAEGWQGLSNEAWRRYVLHEAEQIMVEQEKELEQALEEHDPAPVVKKIAKKVEVDGDE